MEAKIICLVGMVASGKTTYCNKLANSGHLIVNDDAIVNAIHANNYSLYNKQLKILYKTVENTIISMGLGMNYPIVVDRGLNISRNGRQRWIALAKSFDIPCDALLFKKEPAEIHAARRANSDARGQSLEYWLRVTKHHEMQWEEPTLTEGFRSITYLTYKDIFDDN